MRACCHGGTSQCVRFVAYGENAFAEVGPKKSFGDKASMPFQMETFERTDVADGNRRDEALRQVEVSEEPFVVRRR